MTGRLIRAGRHVCDLPLAENRGAIFKCECGRRWVATIDYRQSLDGRTWRRALWPARLSRRSAR